MALSAGTSLGPYEIIAPLGAGGMGEVYRARDPRIGREVAIKVLPPRFSSDPDRLRRFEQEVRAVGALNHPNILIIYDVGAHEGSPYIVSELLEGESLRGRLDGGGLPRRKALDFGAQVAKGLGAAHQKGITHRDLKPENLFLTTDGRAKILDFGLAKLTQPEQAPEADAERVTVSEETLPGTMLGTVGYMSPEQVQGPRADHRSDIFSFGLVLYEMLLERRAFPGNSPVEILHGILKDDPPDLPELERSQPALGRLVRRCLEKNPPERFQSAEDLAFALEQLCAPETSAAAAPTPARRLEWRAAVGLVLLIVSAAALAWWLAARRHAAPAPTFRRLTFRRGPILNARFHPDGQSVIYDAAWDGKPVEIYTTRPESPESRPLGFPGAGILAISPTGEMAISQGCRISYASCEGTLAQVPLSGGAPREILEDVDRAEWSPDGKTLAVVRAFEGFYRLEFPIGKVLYQTTGFISSMRMSPKGDLIAFIEHPALGGAMRPGSVSVVDLQGGKRTLSSGWSEIQGLAWSGSGEIWFTAAHVTAKDLYAVTLAGKQRLILRAPQGMVLNDVSRDGRVLLKQAEARIQITALAPGAAQERNLSWFDYSWLADLSPDGKTLLFSEVGEGAAGVPTVYLRKTDGSDPIRLGPGTALALSPDGKWVLAMQSPSPRQLVLLPTGAGEQKVLPRGAIEDFYKAVWFPDGRRVLFVGEGPDHLPRSYVQDISGGEARPLAAEGIMAVMVAPSGERVLALNPADGTYYLYPVAEGQPAPIRGMEDGDIPLQWTPDGRSLYVRGSGGLILDLYRLDLATGRRQPFKRLAPADPVGVTSIMLDGARLTPDGRFWAYTYATIQSGLFLAEGLR